ncbi:MAG: tetratricopeptide repeat protein [candidate division Zixibacteria bacterium]
MNNKIVISVLALFLGVILAGCGSEDAVTLRFEVEKLYFEAERQVRDASIRPELNDPETGHKLAIAFEEVLEASLEALPEIDGESNPIEYREVLDLAYQSVTRATQYLFAEKQFDKCLQLTHSVATLEGLTRFQVLYLSLNRAQVLQAKGEWRNAMTIYQTLVAEYYPPVLNDGKIIDKLIKLPLVMFQMSDRMNDSAGIRLQRLTAETYYGDLANELPGTEAANVARTSLAQIYSASSRFQDAISQLRQVIDTTGKVITSIRMRIADIYTSQLEKHKSALAIYDSVLVSLEQADTLMRPMVLYRRAEVFHKLKRFSDTRSELKQIGDNYPAFFASFPAPQLLKARAFDDDGNWERAETEYRFLIENFNATPEAMSAYLHLEKSCRALNREAESEHWFERAVRDFDRLSRQRGRVGAMALSSKADLYRQRSMWPEAVGVLTEITSRFERTVIGRQALVTAAAVYREKLNQPQKADSLMEVYKQIAATLVNET